MHILRQHGRDVNEKETNHGKNRPVIDCFFGMMYNAVRKVGSAVPGTELYMLTEHSRFMMGFVFRTSEGKAVVIDGGRPEDMPYLMELVGSRPIAAWILTHPHMDHISGFNRMVRDPDFVRRIGRVYCDFPSHEFERRCEPKETDSLGEFLRVRPLLGDRVTAPYPGMQVTVDELRIEFLFIGGERYEFPKPLLAVNESSLVCRVTGEGLRSVLFLGDLGPEGGKDLLRQYGSALKSDIVQMAHHGHSGVPESVYRAIAPQTCMWCAPDWLWEEADVEFMPELWGTRHTRAWMEAMGVTDNYVTKDGTQRIPLEKTQL